MVTGQTSTLLIIAFHICYAHGPFWVSLPRVDLNNSQKLYETKNSRISKLGLDQLRVEDLSLLNLLYETDHQSMGRSKMNWMFENRCSHLIYHHLMDKELDRHVVKKQTKVSKKHYGCKRVLAQGSTRYWLKYFLNIC